MAIASPAVALEQKLTVPAPDGAVSDRLGNSVAVDGDTIAIGAPVADDREGAVYVYQRVGDSWTQTAKLTASDGAAYDQLGWSVAIEGDTIVAGANGDDVGAGFGQGSVYTFARTGAAARTETAKLTASDGAANDGLGVSVAIGVDTIVAGAHGDELGDNPAQGSVYTFARTGAAARTETAKLTASDGGWGDRLGWSVAIDGDTIVAGAFGDSSGDDVFDERGSVYTFTRTGAATRTETAKLTASDGSDLDRLGWSVAVAGDTIVAGAAGVDIGANANQGSLYTFARTGAVARTETAKLTASDGASQDHLGQAAATDGNRIVAGAPGVDVGDTADQGAIYTFASTGTAIRTETAKLTDSDGATGDDFGSSVAVGPGTIVAGSPLDVVDTHYQQGSASIFFSLPDSDDDGVPDFTDGCPTAEGGWISNGTTDRDSDGCRDSTEDTDDDGDGKTDGSDSCATGDLGWTSSETTDSDSDGCRDATEDTDDDNDTLADGSDSCRTLASNTPNGCPTVSRSLTLSYSAKREKFKGKLTATEPSCDDEDLVTVWKRREEDDAQVGADEVNENGRYVVSKRGRPGKYYATVDERVVADVAACESAISPTSRLR